MPSNLDRMIQLAEEFFQTKNNPDQISVTREVMEQLRRIHPATLTEQNDGDGPIAWILVIPTTHELMERFIAKEIGERALLEMTPHEGRFDAVYLCSALVLPEHRRKGLATRLTCDAISAIRADHPITSLFYWAFSEEGAHVARSVSEILSIPLYARPG